jgi:hypothetical protein
MLKTGNDSKKFLELVEKEYSRLFTWLLQILPNFLDSLDLFLL